MYEFLKSHWVAGAALIAAAFLSLTPLLYDVWPLGAFLIFLHLPGYMIHQVEEHSGDRFRAFVNSNLFEGFDALTTSVVIWANVAGVWGLNLAALYASRLVDPGWAMAAPDGTLINAIVHIIAAVRLGRYNPGLATGLFIFLPLSIGTIWVIPASVEQHLFAIACAIGLHALIGLSCLRRYDREKRSAGLP